MKNQYTIEEYRAALSKERKQIDYAETREQEAVIEYCDIKGYPYNLIFAIENERTTTPQAGARRKRMGVRSGVLDLCLPVARNEYHGLFIEMKSKTGTLTENQKKFIATMTKEDYKAICCYGADEAIKALDEYLK